MAELEYEIESSPPSSAVVEDEWYSNLEDPKKFYSNAAKYWEVQLMLCLWAWLKINHPCIYFNCRVFRAQWMGCWVALETCQH